jgi:hypothetical protein
MTGPYEFDGEDIVNVSDYKWVEMLK